MSESAQQPAKENQKPQTSTAKAFAAQSPTSAIAPHTVPTPRLHARRTFKSKFSIVEFATLIFIKPATNG